jgi:nitroimidazol reductase NimA-like FMN-containing flavoprotein (pyridoxamine 5'-phosphate oxidase superfamily)
MNPNFEIKDKEVIYDVLDKAEYGTLALSVDDTPYSVPHENRCHYLYVQN